MTITVVLIVLAALNLGILIGIPIGLFIRTLPFNIKEKDKIEVTNRANHTGTQHLDITDYDGHPNWQSGPGGNYDRNATLPNYFRDRNRIYDRGAMYEAVNYPFSDPKPKSE